MTERKPRKRIENVPDFHEVQHAALDALNKLSCKPSSPGFSFKSMAERYAYLAFDYLKERYTEPMTLVEFGTQLSNICVSTPGLLHALRTLRGPAVDALYRALPISLGKLERHFESLAVAASFVQVPDAVKERRGRALQKTVRVIADQAAEDFFEITDEKPSRSNNRGKLFTEFLKTLFAALRINEKASSFGQKAVKKWDKKHYPDGTLRFPEPPPKTYAKRWQDAARELGASPTPQKTGRPNGSR